MTISSDRTARLDSLLAAAGHGSSELFCKNQNCSRKLLSEVLHNRSSGQGTAGEKVFRSLREFLGEDVLQTVIVPWPAGKGARTAKKDHALELRQRLREYGYTSMGDFSQKHGGSRELLDRLLLMSPQSQLDPPTAAVETALVELLGAGAVSEFRARARAVYYGRKMELFAERSFCDRFLPALAAHELTIDQFAASARADKEMIRSIYLGRRACDSPELQQLLQKMAALVDGYEQKNVRPTTLGGAIRLRALETGTTVEEVLVAIGIGDKAYRAYSQNKPLSDEQAGGLRRVAAKEFGLDYGPTVSPSIRFTMGEYNLTVGAIAKNADCNETSVTHVLSGKATRAGSGKVLASIAQLTGLDICSLMKLVPWRCSAPDNRPMLG